MVEPPSCPLNIISSLFASDLIIKSEESLLNLPNAVPSSFNMISVPSTSIFKSPPISKVKSPLSDIVEPLRVISSTTKLPTIETEPVVMESVVTMCSMESEPSFFLKNNLPSYVLTASSPKAKLLVLGTFPSVADLFNFIVCAMF